MGAFSANTLPAELSSAPTLCAYEYEHLWRPEEDAGSPGGAATGVYELPSVGAES